MNNIDQLAHQVEKIIEKIKSLRYKFPHDLEDAAKDEIGNAVDALEAWLDFASEDSEDKEDE